MVLLTVIDLLIWFICILIMVAYLTLAERKTLAYMQRRIGPNIVGYYGLIMAFGDALKLLLKEIIIPRESNTLLLYISPIIALVSALLPWCVIPVHNGCAPLYSNISFIFIMAISSIGIFGTLLVGWASNSKYALMGSIRSTAQFISYELILSSLYIIIFIIINNSNINYIIMIQQASNYLLWSLWPLFIILFIASIAETGRPPFDHIEAESELVSGHMTELSASPFVLFYLYEYNNIGYMSYIISTIFIGGFIPSSLLYTIYNYILYIINTYITYNNITIIYIESLLYSNVYAIKSILLIYMFIWVRASLPRLRYDLLINLCWVTLLPIVLLLFIIIPIIIYIADYYVSPALL